MVWEIVPQIVIRAATRQAMEIVDCLSMELIQTTQPRLERLTKTMKQIAEILQLLAEKI